MRDGAARFWGSIGMLAGDVAVCAMLLSISLFFDIEMNMLVILPWIVCLIIQFAVGFVMVQRGSAVSLFAIFHIVVVVAEIVLICLLASRLGMNPNLIALLAIAVAGTGIHAVVISRRSPADNLISIYSDILIVALALYLLLYSTIGPELSIGLILFAAAALVVTLVAVARLRMTQEGHTVSRGSGFGTAAIIIGIIVVCLLITGAVAGIASGQVHGFLDLLLAAGRFVWRILSVAFQALGQALEAVVLFFSRLFSSVGMGLGQNTESATDTDTAIDFATGPVTINFPTWGFSLIMIAVACVVIIIILRCTRHRRFAKREKKSSPTIQISRTNYLKEAIAAFFRKLRARIQFELLYRQCRDTPQGIFLFLLRKCRRRKLKRRRDESPGGFVRRICGLNRCADGTESLLAFASILDESYYAGREHSFEKSESQNYVQAINAFLETIKKNKNTKQSTE